ncbi:MAG TPA: OmpA family protein [Bryobacteraceae bacterium]|nr:OmpA family protein [Bryobacteraceae bacterium]
MKPLICFGLLAMMCFGQDVPQDAEGCKDSPLVARFPGSHINSCEHKEFDSTEMPVGKDKDGNDVTKNLEGEYFYWDIGVRDDVSPLQEYRNFETALKRAGYEILYPGSPDKLTVRKGPQYIYLQFSGSYYYLTTLKLQEMKQEVTADAAAMGNEIDSSGHVAVYGIHFDTGKATILPDSESTLEQVKALLDSRPDLKLRVEGHTDNVGARAANQKLSESRAAAVVAWLVGHGVDKSRLSAQGFADTKPVEDNSSEEGRAKNRRVELVKI